MNKKVIPLSEPCFETNEWKYVKDCLDSGWVSSAGEYVNKLEETVAKYIGRKYAIACSTGTAALHLALLALDIKENEEVILPALSFIAPANAIKYVGAYPVFIDVEESSKQMDCELLKDFLSNQCEQKDGNIINKNTKRIVKAILPVHLLGHSVDMDVLCEIADQYNLTIVEDMAESLGASYKGEKVGKKGEIACLSFNGNKVITAAGGGMVLTDNEEIAKKVKYLSTQAKDDAKEYYHKEVGYNYRLSNVHAAIGLAQMECLDDYVEKKRKVAQRYSESFKKNEKILYPIESPVERSIFWLYTIFLQKDTNKEKSRKLISFLKEKDIQSRCLWHPLSQLPMFEDCYNHGSATTESLTERGVSIPSSVNLTQEDQDIVINAINKFLEEEL